MGKAEGPAIRHGKQLARQQRVHAACANGQREGPSDSLAEVDARCEHVVAAQLPGKVHPVEVVDVAFELGDLAQHLLGGGRGEGGAVCGVWRAHRLGREPAAAGSVQGCTRLRRAVPAQGKGLLGAPPNKSP